MTELRGENDKLKKEIASVKREARQTIAHYAEVFENCNEVLGLKKKLAKTKELRSSINLIINMIDCATSYRSGDAVTVRERLAHAREEAVKVREVLKDIEEK